jgi:hypothetical protein
MQRKRRLSRNSVPLKIGDDCVDIWEIVRDVDADVRGKRQSDQRNQSDCFIGCNAGVADENFTVDIVDAHAKSEVALGEGGPERLGTENFRSFIRASDCDSIDAIGERSADLEWTLAGRGDDENEAGTF